MGNRKKNGGFSLIELIVTIAIMAIAIGLSASIYNLVKSSRITSMAERVNSSISDLRTTTLAKADNYRIIIYKNGEKYISKIEKEKVSVDPITGSIITDWVEYKTTTISDYGSVYCYDSSGNKRNVGDSNTDYVILISFNKANRAFNEISCYLKGDVSFDPDNNIITGSPIDVANNEIHVEYSGRSRKIKMLEVTGKHYIDK